MNCEKTFLNLTIGKLRKVSDMPLWGYTLVEPHYGHVIFTHLVTKCTQFI